MVILYLFYFSSPFWSSSRFSSNRMPSRLILFFNLPRKFKHAKVEKFNKITHILINMHLAFNMPSWKTRVCSGTSNLSSYLRTYLCQGSEAWSILFWWSDWLVWSYLELCLLTFLTYFNHLVCLLIWFWRYDISHIVTMSFWINSYGPYPLVCLQLRASIKIFRYYI